MDIVLIHCPGDSRVLLVNGLLIYADNPTDPECDNRTYDADWVAEQLARAAGVGVRVHRVELPGGFTIWDEDGSSSCFTPEDVRDWWRAMCEAEEPTRPFELGPEWSI